MTVGARLAGGSPSDTRRWGTTAPANVGMRAAPPSPIAPSPSSSSNRVAAVSELVGLPLPPSPTGDKMGPTVAWYAGGGGGMLARWVLSSLRKLLVVSRRALVVWKNDHFCCQKKQTKQVSERTGHKRSLLENKNSCSHTVNAV